ncbi:MAG: hypothetical protein IIW54_01975 [Lachnospiraceae bacterium]|nr:hypothetical protein [Lachnospiraceae bacterium]MBQ2116774.1 hypothetical protein [Lachnospiraceae bacterium]MBQ2405491.1 hypothetical protein [Lachnospiraceae bacterium]MBQ5849575.1 hypothetical protein [Lachnospiraceae bacterium]MEE0918540.1 hypothetical protein [Lachnospiraceae bacterium]
MKKYDIYFVNKEEGRKIASNLEKLRLMKDRGDVVVRLKYTDRKNISIEDIRRKYIMNSDILGLLGNAEKYFVIYGLNELRFVMEFKDFNIMYFQRMNTDWRKVEVEVSEKALMKPITQYENHIINRGDCVAINQISEYGYIYGLSKAFNIQSEFFIQELFQKVIELSIDEHVFGIEDMVKSFICKQGLRIDIIKRKLQ